MKHVKVFGFAVLMACLAAGPAWAASDAPAGSADKPGAAEKADRPERKGLGQGLARALGLSEEKAAEVKSLMQEARKNMGKLKADRDLAKADLDRLLAATNLDEKAISSAADKLAQVNADLTRAMAKARLAVNAALTPEQRARLHELRQGMLERFKERGEGRRHNREPGARNGGRQGDGPKTEGGAC